MTASTRLLFDGAISKLGEMLYEQLDPQQAARSRVIRDIFGRLHVVVPDDIPSEVLDELRSKLDAGLSLYSAGTDNVLSTYRDALDPAALQIEPTLRVTTTAGDICIIDRRVVGTD